MPKPGSYYKELSVEERNRQFFAAAQSGDYEEFAALFRLVDREVIFSKDNKALKDAAKNGHAQIVHAILHSRVANSTVDKSIVYAMIYAAEHGHLLTIEEFLSHEDILDFVDTNVGYLKISANMPLRMAAAKGHLNVVNRLLEIEDVVELIGAQNNDAMISALQNGHADVAEVLAEKIPKRKSLANAQDNLALRYAARKGYFSVVDKLLNIPSVVEKAAVFDNQALYWAVKNSGNPRVVKRLLEVEQVRDNAGAGYNIILQTAIDQKNWEIAEILMQLPSVQRTEPSFSRLKAKYEIQRALLDSANALLNLADGSKRKEVTKDTEETKVSDSKKQRMGK